MLNFVFDNNAWITLFGRSDYSQIKVCLGQFFREKYIRIWFTSTNLTEMMLGVTEHDFASRIESMKQAVTLAQQKYFCPVVTDYLFLDIRKVGLLGLLEKGGITRELCTNVSSTSDFQTFKENNSRVVEEVDTINREFFRNVTDAQKPELEKSAAARKNTAESKCGENKRLSTLRDSVMSLLPLYAPELAPKSDDVMNLMLLLRRRPALLYFSELIRVFSKKTRLNKRKVRKGDGYDFSYVLYLDVCDYLVTNDRSLRSMIEETNLPELLGRAITLEAFLENLTSPFLFPRSPIWIDNPNGF